MPSRLLSEDESYRLLEIATSWFERGMAAHHLGNRTEARVCQLAHMMTHAAHKGDFIGEARNSIDARRSS